MKKYMLGVLFFALLVSCEGENRNASVQVDPNLDSKTDQILSEAFISIIENLIIERRENSIGDMGVFCVEKYIENGKDMIEVTTDLFVREENLKNLVCIDGIFVAFYGDYSGGDCIFSKLTFDRKYESIPSNKKEEFYKKTPPYEQYKWLFELLSDKNNTCKFEFISKGLF